MAPVVVEFEKPIEVQKRKSGEELGREEIKRAELGRRDALINDGDGVRTIIWVSTHSGDPEGEETVGFKQFPISAFPVIRLSERVSSYLFCEGVELVRNLDEHSGGVLGDGTGFSIRGAGE